MAKRRSNAKKLNDDCTLVTFKRAKKGGRILPESQWMTVPRCKSSALKAHNRKQCRVGGKGPKAHLFKPCPNQNKKFMRQQRILSRRHSAAMRA